MQSVYVLVRVRPGFEGTIAQTLRQLKEAKEVHPLFGEYDFIVKLEGETHQAITQVIIERIRAQDGVAATKTLVKTTF